MGLWIARLLLLLLVYQAVWACTTAVSESLLQAKPSELVVCAKCVCVSVTAAAQQKLLCMLLFLEGPAAKEALLFFCF